MIDYITTTRHENVDSLLCDSIERPFVSFKVSPSALRLGMNTGFSHFVFFGYVFTRYWHHGTMYIQWFICWKRSSCTLYPIVVRRSERSPCRWIGNGKIQKTPFPPYLEGALRAWITGTIFIVWGANDRTFRFPGVYRYCLREGNRAEACSYQTLIWLQTHWPEYGSFHQHLLQ